METKKIDFTRLRRLAPGRFSEEILKLLSQGVDFAPYRIEIAGIELGDNPFTEQLSVTFIVTLPDDQKRARYKGQRKGPKLSFTFSADVTPAESLEDFREFVRKNASLAAAAPEAGHGTAAVYSSGHTGN